jgi:hypothetical protein
LPESPDGFLSDFCLAEAWTRSVLAEDLESESLFPDLPALTFELLESPEPLLFGLPLLPDSRSMVVLTTFTSLLQPLSFFTLRLSTPGTSAFRPLNFRPSTAGLSAFAGTVLISGLTVLTSGPTVLTSGLTVLTSGLAFLSSGLDSARLPVVPGFLTASREDFLE